MVSQSISDKTVYRTAPATLGLLKLDGVGPVDNRASTNVLSHFVKKYILHVTHDTWCGMNILSKFQLSSTNSLGFMML